MPGKRGGKDLLDFIFVDFMTAMIYPGVQGGVGFQRNITPSLCGSGVGR